MKRLLAVVASVGMIVVAVVIRSHLDASSTSVTARGNNASGPLTVVCVTELRAACDALASSHPELHTRVEDASVTALALAKGHDVIDGWLTLDPWPDIANGLLSEPVITAESALASSPLVIAMVKERAAVLAPACPGGTIGWKCLGDNVGRRWTELTGGVQAWGNITVGLPPAGSAAGVLLFGNAVSGYFGRADIATNDFENDDAFAAWRAKVAGTFSESDPFLPFVQQLPAKYAAVGVTQAEEQAGVGARADQITIVQPTPAATAIVVLAPIGSGARATQVEKLAAAPALLDALKQAGWAVGQAPPQTGLPAPGVLLALSGLHP